MNSSYRASFCKPRACHPVRLLPGQQRYSSATAHKGSIGEWGHYVRSSGAASGSPELTAQLVGVNRICGFVSQLCLFFKFLKRNPMSKIRKGRKKSVTCLCKKCLFRCTICSMLIISPRWIPPTFMCICVIYKHVQTYNDTHMHAHTRAHTRQTL